MFYNTDFEKDNLRFGDVLKGYVYSQLFIEEPLNENTINEYKYQIETKFPNYCIVMTPCCSIGDNTISLAPMQKINRNFFRHPDVIKNFTLLNREVEPYLIFPPEQWDNLSDDEKEESLQEGKGYEFLSYFFYYENDLFPEYEVITKKAKFNTRFYMIDFRTIFSIKCNKIVKDKIDTDILQSKCLEISPYSRQELREKLAFYFARIPEEDVIYLT